LDYAEPSTAGPPQEGIVLEVVKSGSVVESHVVPRDKTFCTFGRLPVCDFPMEHASISRYHAVLQFHGDRTMAIVDLGSSYGTAVNWRPVAARVPQTVRAGDQIRFGMSSRVWIIGGGGGGGETARPESPEKEPQHDETPTAAEYQGDPVRDLRRFLDRCGHEYQAEPVGELAAAAAGAGVRIELPFADSEGNTLYGAARGADRAAAERLACLDALAELERHGYLDIHRRQRRRPPASGEDEDDDHDGRYYDSTKPGPDDGRDPLDPAEIETHESLLRKLALAATKIAEAERELEALPDGCGSANGGDDNNDDDDDDELDAYMSALARDDQEQQRKRAVARLELLRKQQARLEELARIAAPSSTSSTGGEAGAKRRRTQKDDSSVEPV
ncbi:hypothetical protein H4R18_005520, partial [Coemansia javaensis]